MSSGEGSGSSSASESAALGELLAFFGSVADYAAGDAADHGERVASLAVAIAKIEELPHEQTDALYFAARLRNAGALGNPALSKGEDLSDRARMMALWDVPADGARLCEQFAALPRAAADTIRWQAECWDGTGYPDQLRWSGIPRAAQILHIARAFAGAPDAEEALTFISANAGRMFAPEQTRSFVMWFHMGGGEIEAVPMPHAALASGRTSPSQVLDVLAGRIDAHNATPGRSERIAAIAGQLLESSGADPEEVAQAALGAQVFAAGELRAAAMEYESFDPLSRLGVELRAHNASHAAHLLATCAPLKHLAPIVGARAEWFDGTGGPQALRSRDIPPAGHALALAIAYDALESAHSSRITEERSLPITLLETASGTQFDPTAVRVLAELLKTHA